MATGAQGGGVFNVSKLTLFFNIVVGGLFDDSKLTLLLLLLL